MSPERRAQLVAGPLRLNQLAERAAEEGMSLLDYLGMVRSILTHQLLACSEAADRQGTALLSGRLLECLRTLAQLSGELTHAAATVHNHVHVHYSQDPEFLSLVDEIATVLEGYPEARRAVFATFARCQPATPAMPQIETTHANA